MARFDLNGDPIPEDQGPNLPPPSHPVRPGDPGMPTYAPPPPLPRNIPHMPSTYVPPPQYSGPPVTPQMPHRQPFVDPKQAQREHAIKWIAGGAFLFVALTIAILFGHPASVPAPVRYVTYAAPNGTYTVDRPADWNVDQISNGATSTYASMIDATDSSAVVFSYRTAKITIYQGRIDSISGSVTNTLPAQRLLKMEDELRKGIIGQDDAILAISRAVRRARAGLKDPKRPIGSFMFLGPTGVGKTELTKTLAKFMFGSEDAAVQLDMSEFMERHTASRLVGAPPGYIGYEEAGQLTEALRRRPYSIIVFDEVEKAHPEVHNMLLQIMEEGHLSDAKGRKVDFRNAIIVMTSNIGADMIKKQSSLGFALKRDEISEEKLSYEDMRKKLNESLKRAFRPEFINRLDSVVIFRSLNKEDIQKIVRLELDKVAERLKEHNLVLTATPEALAALADLGYDSDFGARPLRRVIQQKVEDPLSDKLLGGDFRDGDSIMVILNPEGEVVLERSPEANQEEAPVV